MHTSLRLLLVLLMAAGTGTPLLAATNSSSKGKKPSSSSKSETTAKKKTTAKSDATSDKSDEAPAKKKKPEPTPVGPEPVNEDPPTPVATPAVVSTLSIEDISGFEAYPKQIQSLVQSCLALTHLELGYMYGSSEPSKGGMDCSGTIYHVLHFQGLKDVPRQSDEMCNWVDKKSKLYLTPTATSFGSEEFDNLKPGDLLFWTNSLETTRKLPVTHVMVYIGKLKKSGKRIVFGSSDGRSYMGERRSGVSVFDFSLPKPDSTKHFYGYGPTPGLMPVEPERPAIASVTTPPVSAPVSKETPVIKETPAPKVVSAPQETPTPKETAVVKETVATKKPPVSKVASVAQESPTPKETAVVKEVSTVKAPPSIKKSSAASEDTPASKTSVAVKEPAAPTESPMVQSPATPKEEVRKAVAVTTDTPPESASKSSSSTADSKSTAKKTTVADAPAKAKTAATKKRATTVASSSTRRHTPAAPQKSIVEQKIDRAVTSVRRFFQQ